MALRTIRFRSPDIVLRDIQLASEDGRAPTLQPKEEAAIASIMIGDRQAAISAGYITRPSGTRHFLTQAKAFLAHPSRVASNDHSIQESNGA